MEQQKLLNSLFIWPSKNIARVIPLILILGFITGMLVDTSGLKQFILPVTVLMIYPTMIGFKMREIASFSHGKLLFTSMILNFLIVPAAAWLLGTGFLLSDPQLFAGLAITSLLPTSNMTIAFTMLARGNVPGAVKLTTLSLIFGAILAPWYLLAMVGKYVPVDVLMTLKTVLIVILLPLLMGVGTYSLLLKRYTQEQFQKKIKPLLPAASAWGMIFIVFTSISMNADRIASHLDIFAFALLVQVVFYVINYILAVSVGRMLFKEPDALALVFATVLRNLSISIGLAATAFGPNAALMVSLAFLIQAQAAAWFIRLNERFHFIGKNQKPTKLNA